MTKELELKVEEKMQRCRHAFVERGDQRCRIDIDVRALVGGDDLGWVLRIPCRPIGKANKERATCESFSPYTREEAETLVREREESLAKSLKAIVAVHEDAHSKGYGKATSKEPHLKGGVDSMKCPFCPDGTLRYSVASVNGHLHAACTTKGCVSWME